MNRANLNITQEVIRVRAKSKFEKLEELLRDESIKVLIDCTICMSSVLPVLTAKMNQINFWVV